MANKLVQQQLKNVLRGLNDTDIEKILSTYEILSNTQINKNCRMVSYKCYEATMTHKTLTANGYGRTEVEASANCIKNFLEMIMEDEGCLALLIKALKKGNESSSHNVHGRDHHEKSSNVNNTLALNGSYSQVPENNNSFENKKELEILSKNIGNISVIGNHRVSGDVNAANMSQLEMDDLLLKMMLEDGTATGANTNPNQFRKNLPPQHPNGLDLGGQGSKNYNNIYKTEKASQFSQAAPSTDETKKSLQESTNQHHPGRYSLDAHAHAHAQKDEREENRKENGTPSNQYHKSKSSSSSKQLEGRHSYNHNHHHHTDNQKEVTPQRESVGGSNTKCYCNCSEQLQRANLRIESLEKKLKLLTEENKILKYLTSDNKEKEYKTDFSTMPSTNGVPTKSPYEKSVGNYDLTTPHENYEDINEFPERESTKDQTENKRSHSMDVYARKKNFMEHNNQKNVMNYNKENNNSMEKRDARKMVPRLKLEMIPNYHAKFSNASTSVLGHQNTNTQTQAQGGATKGYTQQALQNPSTTNFYSQNSFESTLGAGGTLSSLSKYIKK